MEEDGTRNRTRRAYHSPMRQRQAEEHRRRILAAAHELFTQRGYAGTTLEAIAEAAGVSPKTLVAKFGTKRSILTEVLDPAGLVGRHTPVLEQLRAATDPRTRLRLVAHLTCDVYSAAVPEFNLLRGSGSVAPELAEVSVAVERRRRQQQARLIEFLWQQGALRADHSEAQATDELWALTSFDLYRLLVLESGWKIEQYEMWLSEVLAQRLLV